MLAFITAGPSLWFDLFKRFVKFGRRVGRCPTIVGFGFGFGVVMMLVATVILTMKTMVPDFRE
jgi:hypothetical protein